MSSFEDRVKALSNEQRQLLSRLLSQEVNVVTEVSTARKQLFAYVTASQAPAELDAVALRAYVRQKLPAHMVPDSITVIDSLPHLPNGKIDFNALPEPQLAIRKESTESTEPRNKAEQILSQIWCELLRLDVLSIHDNFFEVGGDSITSIQVVSRAREAGLNLEPRQLADHPTVAGLAEAIATETASQFTASRRSGDAPLTPIQAWFFSRKLAAPEHWNQAFLTESTSRVTAKILADAIKVCLAHHDGLRARFRLTEDGWQQAIPEREETVPLETVEYASFDADEFSRRAAADMRAFELNAGPLIRFVWFTFADGHPARLLVVAHHLIIDHVSWSILLADLDRLCRRTINGEEASLPESAASLIDWTEQLTEYAASDACRESIAYWTQETPEDISRLPADLTAGREPDEDSADTVSFILDKETSRLLNEANQAYHTQTHEILLTALALALKEGGAVRIDLEGHGRESVDGDLDPGQIVGWLTSFFPITLCIDEANDLAGTLKAVKEQIRSLPNRGLNFGVMKYLSGNDKVTDRLELVSDAQVLFNYSGAETPKGTDSLFTPLSFDKSAARSGTNSRSHGLEINAAIVDRQLTMSWTYSQLTHRRSTIERLVHRFDESLRLLMSHCSSDSGGFTPSDFPESGLNQEDLDQLLDEFD